MNKVPLALEGLTAEEIELVCEVFRSGDLTMGARVQKFEQEFASKFNTDFAIMVNSGSSANLLALEVLRSSYRAGGLETRGDLYIAVPAVLWPTSLWPIVQLGFKVLLIDTKPNSLEIDFDQLLEAKEQYGSKLIGAVLIHPLGKALDLALVNKLKLDDSFFVRSINHGNSSLDNYSIAEKLFLETDNYQALELEMWVNSRLLNYLSTINMYKNAIQGALGIEVIMVDSLFFEMEYVTTIEGSEHNEQCIDIDNPNPETYLGRTILSLFPNGFDSMARMIDKDHKAFTPGFHFNKEVHELFAKHLAEKYFNE